MCVQRYVTEKWLTATQNASDLAEAYKKGYYDAMQRLTESEEQIVRCGQCKYAEVADSEDSQDGYTCQFHRGSIWFSGSYCSWAEKKQV